MFIPCSNFCSQRLDTTLAANGHVLAWHQLMTLSGSYSIYQHELGDGQIDPWALSLRVKQIAVTSSFFVLRVNNIMPELLSQDFVRKTLLVIFGM